MTTEEKLALAERVRYVVKKYGEYWTGAETRIAHPSSGHVIEVRKRVDEKHIAFCYFDESIAKMDLEDLVKAVWKALKDAETDLSKRYRLTGIGCIGC